MQVLFLTVLCISASWAIPLSPEKISGGRIVGGDVAKDKQFPWQVAVYFDTPAGTFFCGGSLIDPEWILTSGHCVNGATVFTLHLGSNQLTAADPNRVTVGASHSKLHPGFAVGSLDNDIGLIHLDKPLELNDYIQTIPLSTEEIGEGESLQISGWGASGDWPGVELQLNYVDLKTISNKDCTAIYGNVINDDMICSVGATTQGPCEGDNGGPLIKINDNGKAEQVGIASFVSSRGCTTSDPSGYTRTGNYINWVKSVIDA